MRSCFLSSFVEFLSQFQRRSRKCLSQSEARAAILFFPDLPEKHKRGRRHWELASCQVSLNSVQRFQRRSRKCLSQSEGQGGHFVFRIGPKNTNLVEGIEILITVKFRWIPFSGFRGEVENVSANQRPGRPFCFSDRPKKHKLGRGHWDLDYCQVSLNSIQRFQRRSWKYLSQSEARRPSCFSDRPEKHKLGRGRWDLASCQDSLNSVSAVSTKKLKMSQPIRGQGGHLVFPIDPKNTNLVEGVEILLPVKIPWIPFSRFYREVENVSANQRPGWPSCFSDQPEKQKLDRGLWDLASYQILLNSVQRFQRRSRKCLGQSEARTAILFFGSARKTQTW